MPLRALARINLAAIERNVALLRTRLSAGAGLYAVVKADGYGHGAAAAARAAQAAGAVGLAVATAGEALELREAGLNGPILVMGAVSVQELAAALEAGAELVAWSEEFVREVQALSRAPVAVHVKFDTGMGRLGTRDRDAAQRVAEAVLAGGPAVRLVGAMTHFATADDDLDFVVVQLDRFREFVEELRRRAPDLRIHAANTAATLREPASHFDFVRCGIGIYGCDPMNDDAVRHGLEPALELTSYVAAVKQAGEGDSAGYGRRFVASSPTWLGTVPIGYADGVRRGLTNNGDVLIGGRRHPIVGTVSMDNITVDLGAQTTVRPGDRVTLIGSDGGERLTAEDMARRLGTISYEVVCGISARVPRAYHRDAGSPG